MAQLYYPSGVTLDSIGNMYIADTNNNRICKVTASTGVINTIAGSDGSGGYNGDGGAAVSALLKYPINVALDVNRVLYIADYFNNVIRKITNDGDVWRDWEVLEEMKEGSVSCK